MRSTFFLNKISMTTNNNNNRKRRDELSHKIFLMLQECNKFREHQAREILIELLEKQLDERRTHLAELLSGIQKADELLGHAVHEMEE